MQQETWMCEVSNSFLFVTEEEEERFLKEIFGPAMSRREEIEPTVCQDTGEFLVREALSGAGEQGEDGTNEVLFFLVEPW